MPNKKYGFKKRTKNRIKHNLNNKKVDPRKFDFGKKISV